MYGLFIVTTQAEDCSPVLEGKSKALSRVFLEWRCYEAFDIITLKAIMSTYLFLIPVQQ